MSDPCGARPTEWFSNSPIAQAGGSVRRCLHLEYWAITSKFSCTDGAMLTFWDDVAEKLDSDPGYKQ